jgi:hypothetical protein
MNAAQQEMTVHEADCSAYIADQEKRIVNDSIYVVYNSSAGMASRNIGAPFDGHQKTGLIHSNGGVAID